MKGYLAKHPNAVKWAVAGVVGACIGILVYLRPPTLEQLARGAVHASESGDGGFLVRNMTGSEVRELALTERNVSLFLKRYVRERMAGFERSGATKITPFPSTRQLLAEQDYAHPDGRRVTVSFSAAATPEGPRLVSVIATLTMSALSTDLPAGAAYPGGRAKLAFWGEALQKALPQLASTGIKGLVRQGNPSGKDEVYTFEEFAERSRRLGAQVPDSVSSGG